MKDTISAHYDRARQLALIEVEKRARKILKDHPNLDEFIMGMGSWLFSQRGREDNLSPSYANRAYFKSLDNFIEEWDRYLKLTGHAMRFTATGKKVTNW